MAKVIDYRIRDLIKGEDRKLIKNDLTFEEFHFIKLNNIKPPGFSPDSGKVKEESDSKPTKEDSVKEKPASEHIVSKPEAKETPLAEKPSPKEETKVEPQKIEVKDTAQPKSSPKVEEDEWVTVKNRGKKRELEPSVPVVQKFETLAEQQLSTNKNKKKSIKKKLKEISELLKKQSEGVIMNPFQLQKISNKDALEKELLALAQ